MIEVEGLGKRFVLHNQGGAVIEVMAGAHLKVGRGECVALTGASGAGKSTLMRMIHGNYRASEGRIVVARDHPAAARAAGPCEPVFAGGAAGAGC